MVSEATETKCKVIIKAFLLANKGKRFTSKEIADFINHNDFGLGKYSLHNYTVTKWIKSANRNLLEEIKMERKDGRHLWRFWI